MPYFPADIPLVISVEGDAEVNSDTITLAETDAVVLFTPADTIMPMAAAAVALGGNVRAGLEDNIWLDRGVPATNTQLVARVVEIVERMGGRVLSPQEARNKLNLRGADT